jgi:hypothetical protein
MRLRRHMLGLLSVVLWVPLAFGQGQACGSGKMSKLVAAMLLQRGWGSGPFYIVTCGCRHAVVCICPENALGFTLQGL